MHIALKPTLKMKEEKLHLHLRVTKTLRGIHGKSFTARRLESSLKDKGGLIRAFKNTYEDGVLGFSVS